MAELLYFYFLILKYSLMDCAKMDPQPIESMNGSLNTSTDPFGLRSLFGSGIILKEERSYKLDIFK
jgi:hypothetical protein